MELRRLPFLCINYHLLIPNVRLLSNVITYAIRRSHRPISITHRLSDVFQKFGQENVQKYLHLDL